MRFLSLSRAAALVAVGVFSISTAFAAAVKLEVTAPTTAKTGEAIDVTVRAVDSDGKTVIDYLGTIFFTIIGDEGAAVPNANDGYTFIDKDQGTKTFSKGITFKKEGALKINVVDLDNDKLEGLAAVTVAVGSLVAAGSEKITVLSPESNVSVSDSKLPVVGKTKANSLVVISLNGAKAGDTQSDANGNFKFDLTGLVAGANSLRVDVLDGKDAVIGTSGEIAIKLAVGGATLKGISIKEGTGALAGSVVTLVAASETSLAEVLATLNGQTFPLAEDAINPGTYVSKIQLPAASGSWAVDVSLKNKLGVVTKSSAATTIVTSTPAIVVQPVVIDGQKITFNFALDQDAASIASFAIEYGTGSVETLSLTGAVKTDLKSRIATASGFAWYINNVPYGTYNAQIVALDASGAVIPGVVPAITNFELVAPLPAAPVEAAVVPEQCFLGNIEDIKVTTDAKKTKSVLAWGALSGAISYNVYKKDATGQPVLVENVTAPTYTAYISGNKVTFDEFSVKGVCANPNGGTNESPEFKQMVKAQTGPALFMAILMLAVIGGWAMMRLTPARK